MTMRKDGFYVAPLTPDGELLGIAFWEYCKLSKRWLDICIEFLHPIREGLSRSWGAELSHIETKLTNASGAATVSFYVSGHLASSCLFMFGKAHSSDTEVQDLFLESAERMAARVSPQFAKGRFKQLSSIEKRPLAVFVIWAPEEISDDDMELVKELSIHLSGAFFQSSILKNQIEALHSPKI